MEVKCECDQPKNNRISSTLLLSSEQQPRCSHPAESLQGRNSSSNSSSNNRSRYWSSAIPPSPKPDGSSSWRSSESYKITLDCGDKSNRQAKDMASWRPSSTSCFSSCIPARRLNRTYSEQRIRCLLTTIIAFCLGISVGALLPFFFPPIDILPSPLSSHDLRVTESILNARGSFQLAQPEKLIVPPYFVEETKSPPRAPLLLEEVATYAVEKNESVYSPVTFVDKNSLSTATFSQDAEKESVSSSSQKVASVVDGIYWSEWVERLLPRGFSDQDVATWRSVAGNSTVTSVEAGCGRMQNRLISYENGQKACCRYRQNFDQIQGEIYSFYLSQLLGITNLAPSTLDVVDSKSSKWSGVLNEVQAALWVDDKPVVLTQFVNNLSPAFIPPLLRSSTRRVHPSDILPAFLTVSQITEGNSSEQRIHEDITDLAQWSDLIVFDYLTANLDRMVNNLYNLQWNPSMMEAPAHNLAKEMSSGLLVFLDNESGLLHGYRLLDKYEHYHRLMLDSLCVFRKSTAEAVRRLHSYGSLQPLFKSMLSQFQRSQLLPMIPDKSIKVLSQRIDTVYKQIQKCQSLYSSSNSRTGNT